MNNGADFIQAMEWVKCGLKIRRKHWVKHVIVAYWRLTNIPPENFLYLYNFDILHRIESTGTIAAISKDDLMATDWELYE